MKKCFLLYLFILLYFTVIQCVFAQVTIPNTFSSGTPAVADEVNANFNALKNAIDTNTGEIANLAPTELGSGYSTLPPYSAAGAPKNLVILKNTASDGRIRYYLRIAFEDSSGNKYWHFPYVRTGTDGTTAEYWDNTVYEISDTSSLSWTYTDYATESGAPTGTTPSVVSSQIEELDVIIGKAYVGKTRVGILRGKQVLSSSSDFGKTSYQFYSRSYISGSSTNNSNLQSITINSMTFNDVYYRLDVDSNGTQRMRIGARNIGMIYENSGSGFDHKEIIYYRVDGTSGGSLSGTPFESGGFAYGYFFTP